MKEESQKSWRRINDGKDESARIFLDGWSMPVSDNNSWNCLPCL